VRAADVRVGQRVRVRRTSLQWAASAAQGTVVSVTKTHAFVDVGSKTVKVAVQRLDPA
jgi:hypothetical protein